MRNRLELHDALCRCLGSNYVYFSPPPSIDMHYPCIVYKRDGCDTVYADNRPYRLYFRYTITLISYDPDIHDLSNGSVIETSSVHEALMNLPYCKYDRPYVADGLHHDVYTISL